MKTCNKCGETKSDNEFYRSGNGLQGACKICDRASNAIYRTSHAEELVQYRLDNAERASASQAAWAIENSEWVRARAAEYYINNKEQEDARHSQWKKDNPEKVRGHAQKRRALLASAIIEDFLDLEIFERDNWICQLCWEPIDPELRVPNIWSKSLDHIIPISKNGNHTRDNVQASHLSCNAKKRNRILT